MAVGYTDDFLSNVLSGIFANANLMYLGTNSTTNATYSNYSSRACSVAGWDVNTASNGYAITNNTAIYFNKATADYSSSITHLLIRAPGSHTFANQVLCSIQFTTPLTLLKDEMPVIKRFYSTSYNRGIYLNIWRDTGS